MRPIWSWTSLTPAGGKWTIGLAEFSWCRPPTWSHQVSRPCLFVYRGTRSHQCVPRSIAIAESMPESSKTAASKPNPHLTPGLEDESDADDEADSEATVQKDAKRQQWLAASGLLSRKPTRRTKRKPPAPPKKHSDPPQAETQVEDINEMSPEEIQSKTEDAFDRWMALQKDLPPMSTVTDRSSLALSTTSSRTGRPSTPSTPAPTSSQQLGSSFMSKLLGPSTRQSIVSESPAAPITRLAVASPQVQPQSTQHVSFDEMALEAVNVVGPQTWSSLIDAEALAALPEKERKRQESIFELILVRNPNNPLIWPIYLTDIHRRKVYTWPAFNSSSTSSLPS